MFELIGGKLGTFAVPYTNKRPLKPIRLPDGTIVEEATAEDRRKHMPGRDNAIHLVANLGITASGDPVPFDKEGRLFGDPEGQAEVYIGVTGAFLLPDGRVAAVYGGRAEEISVRS
jgi:hypothetical protein